ncbi:hypothetical protein ACLOJK_019088 [Asimina triloba]
MTNNRATAFANGRSSVADSFARGKALVGLSDPDCQTGPMGISDQSEGTEELIPASSQALPEATQARSERLDLAEILGIQELPSNEPLSLEQIGDPEAEAFPPEAGL